MKSFKVDLTATRRVLVAAENAEEAEKKAERFRPLGWTLEEAVCESDETGEEET